MRDRNDNVVIVCSIENIDPMGVHTGDSVTVAPQQTLTDRLYQQLRDQAIACIRAVGVETGGSNVQFAVNPRDRGDPRHRDEPARVALVGAGVEGHGLPDREDRRAAGGRLRARGDPQRHHAADAGQSSSRRSTTWSSSGRGSRSRSSRAPTAELTTHMKSRGRGDGDRPHVQAGVRQGDALARARRAAASSTASTTTLLELLERPAPDRFDVLFEAFRARRLDRGACTRARRSTRGSCASCAALARRTPRRGLRRRALVQGGRHLRGRVRGRDAVLLLGLGAPRRARGAPRRPAVAS